MHKKRDVHGILAWEHYNFLQGFLSLQVGSLGEEVERASITLIFKISQEDIIPLHSTKKRTPFAQIFQATSFSFSSLIFFKKYISGYLVTCTQKRFMFLRSVICFAWLLI